MGWIGYNFILYSDKWWVRSSIQKIRSCLSCIRIAFMSTTEPRRRQKRKLEDCIARNERKAATKCTKTLSKHKTDEIQLRLIPEQIETAVKPEDLYPHLTGFTSEEIDILYRNLCPNLPPVNGRARIRHWKDRLFLFLTFLHTGNTSTLQCLCKSYLAGTNSILEMIKTICKSI